MQEMNKRKEIKEQKKLQIIERSEQNKTTRNIKFEYIQDSKERASVRYVRNKGLEKKIRWFDQLTGAQSCLLSLNKKLILKTFSNGFLKLIVIWFMKINHSGKLHSE